VVAMLNPQCILHIGPKGMSLDEVWYNPLYPKVQTWIDGVADAETHVWGLYTNLYHNLVQVWIA
jgi:hypothetical protein